MGASVAALEGDPPVERLNITQARLGLDRDPPARTVNDFVPCTQVARHAEGHLGAMPKVRKTRTETREQRELGGVSYGIAGRKRTERHDQPEAGRYLNDRLERDVPQHTALNPADLRRRDIGSSRQLPKGEACLKPRVAQLLTDPHERLRREASRPVHAPFSIRHGTTLPDIVYLTIINGRSGTIPS